MVTLDARIAACWKQRSIAMNSASPEDEDTMKLCGEHIIAARRNLSVYRDMFGGAVADCTGLKYALLSAKVEGDFLCLPGSQIFPVSFKEAINTIPSKLLMRSFHRELKLILQKLRHDRKITHNNGGAVFYGPTGTGKSWASMSVLVDELADAQESGKTVVYFDAVGKRAFVFSKDRSMLIGSMISPNVGVFIYDAAVGSQDMLTMFCCETLIFASPCAENFKQTAQNNSLIWFACPNWTVEELKLLERGCGDRFPPEEIERRFERFGGSPRSVVVAGRAYSDTQKSDARALLGSVIFLWLGNMDWSSCMLKARYSTEAIARTPEEAYSKYLKLNVVWDYSNTNAMKLVHAELDKASEANKLKFQSWLEYESKARIICAHWFEHNMHSLFSQATNEDIEVKALEPNDGLNADEDENLTRIISKVNRSLTWNIPKFKEIRNAPLVKHKQSYSIASLKDLTDPTVLYRLPDGFPLIHYYNPPNNCFSVGVGEHILHLGHAVDLCKNVIPSEHQVNFVYVTPTSNYDIVKRWQSFDAGSEGEKVLGRLPSNTVRVLARMVQFCMRFKKF